MYEKFNLIKKYKNKFINGLVNKSNQYQYLNSEKRFLAKLVT